jgi:hypothetical protein
MKPLKLKNDKRGVIGIIMFFLILMGVLIIGFIAAMLTGVFDFASDTITPVMKELGMVDDINVSESTTIVFGTMETVSSSLPLLMGFLYVGALIFSVIFAVSYSFNPNPILIGFYLLLIVLLIFAAITMSNMYQDIYSGTDEIATRLREQTLLSYMILYSPYILSVIAFITGIYLFSRPSDIGGVGI